MRATSQASLAAANERWEATVQAGGSQAAQYGEDLFAVVSALDTSAALRRALTEPNREGEAKAALLTSVFEGKVSGEVVDLLAGMARSRWSAEQDYADAAEQLAITALLASVESRDKLASLEEDIFQITRTLADNRDLRLALANRDRSAQDRVELLRSVFANRVEPETFTLVARTVGSLRSKSVTAGLLQVSELAAARRRRLLATVTAAVPLTEAQQVRLADMLSRAYGRTMEVNLAVDPTVVGGLRIQVGDELVDGTMVTRVEEARRRIAG